MITLDMKKLLSNAAGQFPHDIDPTIVQTATHPQDAILWAVAPSAIG